MQNTIRDVAAKVCPKRGYLSRALVLVAVLLFSVSSGVDVGSIQAKSSKAESIKIVESLLYHPAFEQSAKIETSLYLYNEDTQAVSFTVTFYDQTGGQAGVHVGSIDVNSFAVVNNQSLSSVISYGFYSATVSSDGNISSVVRTFNQDMQTLSLYRGASSNDVSSKLLFGPFFKTATRDSSIHLQHVSLNPATVSAQAIAADGSVAQTISRTINGSGWLTISAADFDLPDEFTGWVQVTADQRLAGLLAPTSRQDQIGLYPPVAADDSQQVVAASVNSVQPVPAYLPRAYNNILQGNGRRNTKVFVGNPSAQAFLMTGTGYEPATPQDYSGPFLSVPGNGFAFSTLEELLSSNVDFSGSIVLSSDDDMVVAELTESDGGYAMASYGSGLSFTDLSVQQRRASAAQVVTMPYIGHGSDHYSILSIQNSASSVATISVTFVNLDGSIQLQETFSASPNRSIQIDTREQADLAAGFAGSVAVISDQVVLAYVDEYVETTSSAVPTSDPSATDTPTPDPSITDTPTPLPTSTQTPMPTQTPTPTPTVFVPQTAILPPSIRVLTEGSSFFVDTTTGEVIVNVTQEDRSQITVQRVATCADGSAPLEVNLVADWESSTKRYAMNALIFGLYETIIPVADIIGNADLRVEVNCNALLTSARVGSIGFTASSGSQPLYLPIIQR